MKLVTLLFIPVLAIAGNYSGTITNLAGTGLIGVTISSTGFTATTDAQGHWALGGGMGISAQTGLTHSVSQHFVVENGHLGLVWNGANIQGRLSGVRSGVAASAMPGAARSAVAVADTIVVQWKGKHLVRLPMTNDSSGITLYIDTAWSDDLGVARNPKISYGSVYDTRDGQVYRTVAIGTQTWMAENLRYAADSSWCFEEEASNCAMYGRLYQWTATMALATIYNTKLWGGSDVNHRGICPSGWHVPSHAEWKKLTDTIMESTTAGTKLKANGTQWTPSAGTDDYGFTVLPAGCRSADGSFFLLGSNAYFWSASTSDTLDAWLRFIGSSRAIVHGGFGLKSEGSSLRCLKD